MPRPTRIGIDTGGTFTDLLALFPDGRLLALKLSSSPADPAQAVLRGVAELRSLPEPQTAPVRLAGSSGPIAINRDGKTEIVHGTTVATNALLTRGGGPTALLVTEGFTDLLRLGRQARPRLYALDPELPPPLVPPQLCVPVPERLGPDGAALTPLTDEALAALREQVAALGVASVAVVLLHSYASDRHERAVAEALRPLGLPVSLSSQVLPAPREYERACATVADAYVAPVVAGYLGRLQAALAGDDGVRLRVLQSHGGASLASEAVAAPVRTLLSGPAAGVLGAQVVAAASGARRVITLDMGGTSTDVALIDGAERRPAAQPMAHHDARATSGSPSRAPRASRAPSGVSFDSAKQRGAPSMEEAELAITTEAELGGVPIPLPMLAVHSVGAGGGSIVRVDAGGALHIGPDSAGADPGPACYGRGGTAPTVTDADLVLGRLWPERFCGGAVQLSQAAARAALAPLAERLGLPLLTLAAGVAQLTGVLIARAVRTITVERGHDPADFTLLPFGGAGGLHAAEVAEELGIRKILCPPAPGLLSAYGALCARVVREAARTLLCEASGAQADGVVAATLKALRAEVEDALAREGGQRHEMTLTWSAELRYHGQSYELALPGLGDGRGEASPETDLVSRFHQAHQQRYGFTLAGRRVDLVALRVRGVLPGLQPAPVQLSRIAARAASTDVVLGETTLVFPAPGGGGAQSMTAPVLDRGALRPETTLRGPALLVEYSATTVVPGGWTATVDDYGALHLSA